MRTSMLTAEDAVFGNMVGDYLKMTVVVLNAGFSTEPGRTDQNAELLVFLGTYPYAGGEHPSS
jgi:hypothetical protein